MLVQANFYTAIQTRARQVVSAFGLSFLRGLLAALILQAVVFGQDPGLLAEARRANDNFFSLYKEGNYREAIEWARKVCELRERAYGRNHSNVANGLNNLGALYLLVNEYETAEPILRRALSIMERVRGASHPDTADVITSLGRLAYHRAQYPEAERHFRRVLQIHDRSTRPDPSSVASAVNNLGMVLRQQGKLVEAAPLLRRALRIEEERSGANHLDTATQRGNLASVYFLLGNYAAAEPLYVQTLKAREANLSPNHPDISNTLSDLGMLYNSQGRFAEAEKVYQRAVRICEETLGPNHSATAGVLNNLGSVYADQQKWAAAEPLLRRSLQFREKSLGPEHLSTAVSENNVAWVCMALRQFDEAERLYLNALNTHKKLLGKSHPDTVRCFDNIARLYAAKGDPATAANFTDDGRRAIREYLAVTLPALPQKEQSLFLSVRYQTEFQSALSLALAHSDDASLCKLSAGWLLNGKAVVQEALAQGNLTARAASDPATAGIVQQLRSVRDDLAAAALTVPDPDTANKHQEQIAALTAKERELSGQLAEAGGGADTASGQWVEYQELREALPADAALIDIAKISVHDFTAVGDEQTTNPTQYVAWITHNKEDSAPTIVDLGPAEEIDALVASVRESLQSAPRRIQESSEEVASAELKNDLQELSRRIWAPLQSELSDAKQMIISPDGELWLAPWNALIEEQDATDTFLIEEYTIRLVVSGRDLVSKPNPFVSQAPVILANPNFDQQQAEKRSSIQAIFRKLFPAVDSAVRDFSAKLLLGKVPALPNTAIEAAAIQPNMESYSGQKAQVYKERYALEQVVKALHSPRIVAFATHGFFLPTQQVDDEDRARSGSEQTRSVPVDTNGQPIENPLLRCGLLLAGCNNRDAVVGDDDGILTGLEIVGIDLRGTELVVLSACETGIGDVRSGEGVAGLRQAFQLAGAQAVVSTLWQVPDRDSALLVSRFFRELAAGKLKADALRNAQLERIEKRRERYGAAHPYYWAAFTLTGQ